LSGEVEFGERPRLDDASAEDAVAARAVGLAQIAQQNVLAEQRRAPVAGVDAVGESDFLVVLEGRAALLEGQVEPAEIEANAPAVGVSRVAQAGGDGELVAVGDKRGYAAPEARGVVIGEVWREPRAGQQLQLRIHQPARRVERALAEQHAVADKGIGEGRNRIEVGDVAVVEAEAVEAGPERGARQIHL
jgi:hypothetical protein